MAVIIIVVGIFFPQDSDDYSASYLARESPALTATRRSQVGDGGDSSGQSDAEDASQEMSDDLKRDPIISKYAKYRVTKKTPQQKTTCTFSALLFFLMRSATDL